MPTLKEIFRAPGVKAPISMNPTSITAHSTPLFTGAGYAPTVSSPETFAQPTASAATPGMPESAPQFASTPSIPPQFLDPKSGGVLSPSAVADNIANTLPKRTYDVPTTAGDLLTNPDMSASQLTNKARDLNNARNDIAVGETDPYGTFKGDLAFSPEQRAAIEKAYAGIYDPALKDVFTKLEERKKSDDRKFELEKMAQQHKYNMEEKGLTGGSASEAPAEYSSLVDMVSNLESSVSNRKVVRSQLASMLASGDHESAYGQIANSVETHLTGTNKTKFADARTDLGVLEGMKAAIKQYAKDGGDMGLLTGTEEDIKRKLGIDTPKASRVATQLWREFQTYRNNMTGAAFGASESRDYASVNPTLGKSLDLNLSVIEGAQDQLRNRINSTIDARVPSAKKLRQKLAGETQAPEKGDTPSARILSKDGQSFDASDLSDDEYKQALADGYIEQ